MLQQHIHIIQIKLMCSIDHQRYILKVRIFKTFRRTCNMRLTKRIKTKQKNSKIIDSVKENLQKRWLDWKKRGGRRRRRRQDKTVELWSGELMKDK